MNSSELAGLMPLEPPPAPAADLWPLAGLALLLLLAGLCGLWLWQRPQRRRLRRLRSLQRQLQNPAGDARQLAGELEQLLCVSLGRQWLQADTPPPAIDKRQWQQLLDGLHAARFSAAGTDRTQLVALLPDIRRLMSTGP